MTRARDVSRLITTPPSIYATDSEASAGYLSLSSASSTYLTQSSASTNYAPIAGGSFVRLASTGYFTEGTSSKSFNNIFNSNYNIYKIYYYRASPSNNGAEIRLRLRANGSDIQGGSDYTTVLNGYSSSGASKSTTSSTSSFFLNNYAVDFGLMEIILETPYIGSSNRAMLVNTIGYDGGYPARVGGGRHFSSTAADGFTIFVNAGTIGGRIEVYGIKNA
jgi:hypothetical protein